MCGRGRVCGGANIIVCVFACACVFLPMAYKKKCIDCVDFVCGAHYGGGRGDNGGVHK